jgi:hypothetical protein
VQTAELKVSKPATTLFDFICAKSAQIIALPSDSIPVKTVKVGSELTTESSKIAEAVRVIDQQQALIGGLQSAHLQAVKIAAALAEATKLAQDGAIDVGDVFDFARRSLVNGTVKLSSVDDLFDQSPGEIITGAAAEVAGKTAAPEGTDILTRTLRDIRVGA